MKLSNETIEVLKNFSTINQSIQVKKGNVLSTISPLKTVFAVATVAETFPVDFAIYDLNKFLAKVSLYKDCDISFQEKQVLFKTTDNKRTDYIKYCSEHVIVRPPDKRIAFGTPDYTFNLSQSDLEWQRKSAGISGSPNFIFVGDGEKTYLVATDIKDDSSDYSKTEIGDADSNFHIVMKVENFKMIDGDYTVDIEKRGLSRFSHSTKNVQYYVAVEASQSTFG